MRHSRNQNRDDGGLHDRDDGGLHGRDGGQGISAVSRQVMVEPAVCPENGTFQNEIAETWGINGLANWPFCFLCIFISKIK